MRVRVGVRGRGRGRVRRKFRLSAPTLSLHGIRWRTLDAMPVALVVVQGGVAEEDGTIGVGEAALVRVGVGVGLGVGVGVRARFDQG